jgi:hypothetical protein
VPYFLFTLYLGLSPFKLSPSRINKISFEYCDIMNSCLTLLHSVHSHTHTQLYSRLSLCTNDRTVRYSCCCCVSELSFRPFSTLACRLHASLCQLQGAKPHCAHPMRKFAAECEMPGYHSGTVEDSGILGCDAVSCEWLATFRRLRHIPEYLNALHFIVTFQVSFVFC